MLQKALGTNGTPFRYTLAGLNVQTDTELLPVAVQCASLVGVQDPSERFHNPQTIFLAFSTGLPPLSGDMGLLLIGRDVSCENHKR